MGETREGAHPPERPLTAARVPSTAPAECPPREPLYDPSANFLWCYITYTHHSSQCVGCCGARTRNAPSGTRCSAAPQARVLQPLLIDLPRFRIDNIADICASVSISGDISPARGCQSAVNGAIAKASLAQLVQTG